MISEDLTNAISEIVSKAISSIQNPAPEVKSAEVKYAPEDSEKKSIVQKAREELEQEKNANVALSQIQQSIKFNLSIGDFIENNKELLPEEINKVLASVNAKTFRDDNEKANSIRKNLLDSFLSQKENIDCLIPSLASRANQYNALAESEKEKRSSEFWDLAEVGVALKLGARKSQSLNRLNGVIAGEDSKNIIGSKMLALAKERYQPTKL
jgi:hypothetical protein